MSPADVPVVAVPPATVPASTSPVVSPTLLRGLDAAIAAVPADKRGLAGVTVTKQGIEAAVGARIWRGLSVGGYAMRAWQTKDATIGARAQFIW